MDGTPNAAPIGKRVEQDKYLFIWSPSKGAYLIPTREGQSLVKFYVENRVPFFPAEGRRPELQRLADAGMAAEVRRLEALTEDELREKLYDFKAYFSAWREERAKYGSAEEFQNDPNAVSRVAANASKRRPPGGALRPG